MEESCRSVSVKRPIWFRVPRAVRIFMSIVTIGLNFFSGRREFDLVRLKVLIIVKDIYSTLPLMVEALKDKGVLLENIILLDTGSTSVDCIKILEKLKDAGVDLRYISREEQVFGPYLPWLSRALNSEIRSWNYPFILTDSDLMIPSDMPQDVLPKMFNKVNEFRFLTKIALPLRTRDITNMDRGQIIAHETSLGQNAFYRILNLLYGSRLSSERFCQTDTTFALYRTGRIFTTISVRLDNSYEILHLPWYDWFCQSVEFKHYVQNKLPGFGHWSSTKS